MCGSKSLIASLKSADARHEIPARRTKVATLFLSVLAVVQVSIFVPARGWSATEDPDPAPRSPGLGIVVAGASSAGGAVRLGRQETAYTRIPNGIARASSSGDNRPPVNAFDRNLSTFWRNRTNQTGFQYLEMDFNGPRHAVRRISLRFGNHYPRDYRFRIKRNGAWAWGRSIVGNVLVSRTHTWAVPMQDVQAVRVYCLRYSMDDYFSVLEMVIEK